MSEPNSMEVITASQAALVEVQKSREIQEVQGAIISAKKFPRDTHQAFLRIMESCKRHSLAAQATYSYPRAGQTISGPSIRLAEVLAQNYGNLDFGIQELERREGVSIVRSYCWDMETNTRQTKTFEVPHVVHKKTGESKLLSDPRDIYENVANMGARRLRACILGIIPGDIVEAAVDACHDTLKRGVGEPIEDRIRKMIMAFKALGISQDMIEQRLNHKIDLTTTEEIVELHGIHNAIRDKQADKAEFFKVVEEKKEGETNEKSKKLTEIFKEKK